MDNSNLAGMSIKEIELNLADVIGRVYYGGERIVITKHGKPEAEIGPVGEAIETGEPVGSREVRLILGELAARARLAGRISIITRKGRPVAAIRPLAVQSKELEEEGLSVAVEGSV